MVLIGLVVFVLSSSVIPMSTQAQDSSFVEGFRTTPPIRIEVFPKYWNGFPMVVSAICYNPSEKEEYYHLPEVKLFSALGPMAFSLVDEEGSRITLPATINEGEGPRRGFTLSPGASRRMLFDLSSMTIEPTPGEYEISAEYRWQHGASTAPAKTTVFEDPPSEDSTIAAVLRSQTDSHEVLWSHFVKYNWRTIYTERSAPKEAVAEGRAVDATGLSRRGRKVLAFYLFLHRATYGPKGVSELRPSDTEAFARGPLKGEAAVLRYEILVARDDPAAAETRKEILEQFPGLQWRVEAIEDGNGRLARLRRMYGAEQDFTREPDFFPYTEQ